MIVGVHNERITDLHAPHVKWLGIKLAFHLEDVKHDQSSRALFKARNPGMLFSQN